MLDAGNMNGRQRAGSLISGANGGNWATIQWLLSYRSSVKIGFRKRDRRHRSSDLSCFLQRNFSDKTSIIMREAGSIVEGHALGAERSQRFPRNNNLQLTR